MNFATPHHSLRMTLRPFQRSKWVRSWARNMALALCPCSVARSWMRQRHTPCCCLPNRWRFRHAVCFRGYHLEYRSLVEPVGESSQEMTVHPGDKTPVCSHRTLHKHALKVLLDR